MMGGQGVLESFDEQLVMVRKDAIQRGLIRNMDETPKLWLIWVFGQWAVQIANPEDFKELLTKTEQYEKFNFDDIPGLELSRKFMGTNIAMVRTPIWKTHRRIVNPAFRRGWATSLFGSPARNLLAQLDKVTATKQPMDAADFMQRMTLDALSVAAFRKNFNSLANPNAPMVATYNRIMTGIMNPVFALFGPLGQFLPMSKRLDKDIHSFNQFMFELVDGKLAEMQSKDDHADEEDDDNKDLLELMIRAQLKEGSTFSREDLRSNCVAFFIAGHDTTANALTFALYMLGMNPDKQEKARKEILDIMGDVSSGTSADEFPYPTNDQQNQMSYLTCIIKETMRIWPSIVVMPMRELMSPATLHSGLSLPRGSLISSNVYALQRAKEYWGADANQFKPERWTKLHDDMAGAGTAPGDSAPLHPGAHGFMWTPFGGGSRFCLGSNFSIIEQRVVLAMMLLRYTWKVVGNDKALRGRPESEPGILLHPHGIMLELTRRN
ncbi:cytochrome P450 [Catenaria anguillulae PL171]|uniref:Cytochrome P450 n=1 Tax=Catenaria anguillulae PL171 TaxID=765915 RepID=A0A1Y2HQ70_9FUNG|nr:cytochrome P450 [Catenaria anguillulae PL171]